jgi:hypothetical protein
MNGGAQREAALELRRWAEAERHRKEAEKARETAKQVRAGDRPFWLALAENWEKLAKETEAPKIRPWST